MKYQLTRVLYPYRCSKYALLYIGKFLLKEKQLHSIEMDCRYKQAPPYVISMYPIDDKNAFLFL